MDHAFMRNLKSSVSCIDFKDEVPLRCLDLGTGLGDWVIDAAKQWPDSTFVGYDLVNIQIPLVAVEKSIANRIQWVHGNFLRQKLPFEDDEFDYVHIHGIALGVPENKWHNLFEEIHRVLRPGGTVECIEEDATFPVLPRWFTAPLHAPRKRRLSVSEAQTEVILPQPMSFDELPHDHALLESLYNSLFHNRFVNPTPSSSLPSYFSACFGHVTSPPVIKFPMPPLAPMLPEPSPPASFESQRSGVDAVTSTRYRSDSSASSQASSTLHSEYASSSMTEDTLPPEVVTRPKRSNTQVKYEGTRIGSAKDTLSLFPLCNGDNMDDHTLFMQLKRSVALVLSAKEAMWEELKERIEERERENEREELIALYGWEDSDLSGDAPRKIFDRLVERYKEDMHMRVSLWHLLTDHGWELPKRDALTKAEYLEEQRFRRAIIEAQHHAKEDDMRRPCRSVRLLVGQKVIC
ncbi:hypothetical protein BDY19DRAFT_912415 [Irpex rosettiformis]|uniref:Uncharacterized protein n=1 Tax=Irpex rosettiformis TaxID=378272 RepID=A0ACB8UKZ5_9APHY|nr:hypothetical protein BDY19DRAFT_912415 [Irpex rosettiformis]